MSLNAIQFSLSQLSKQNAILSNGCYQTILHNRSRDQLFDNPAAPNRSLIHLLY